MLIDWYTVAAQAFNFLLLVWVLKRFLYKPVRRAMHQRQERIAQDLEQADQARTQAEERLQALTSERAKLESERRALLEKSRQEARQWREQALEKARQDLEEQRRRWHQAILEERNAFAKRLTARIAATTCEVCRKALADLADADLETRLADKLLTQLAENNAAPPAEIIVRTGFALHARGREHLRTALLELWPELGNIVFEQNEQLGFGIECLFGENKVSWNVEQYIRGLQEQVLASVAQLPETLSETDKENGPDNALEK